jgi:coenzyme F420-reducing hydrogenase delta subunit/Pyruvate/2-oxoacid:ferredoxin oxidoreductase delta subunit
MSVLAYRQVRSFKSVDGRYDLTFSTRGQTVFCRAKHIVLAHDAVSEPNFYLYGLNPCDRAVTLTQARALLTNGSGPAALLSEAGKTVFVNGVRSESSPVVTEKVMRAALSLRRDFSQRVYILAGNLKVAGNGLEALFRETKQAGIIYVKFTQSLPTFHQADDGAVAVTFTDEITRETFRLTPDVTVVDEVGIPPKELVELGRLFELHEGPDGFPQSDNVHRLPVGTNRRGVFVVAPARDEPSDAASTADACNVALSVFNAAERPLAHTAAIDKGRCVRCLTCYRVCPYRAIVMHTRPVIDPLACEGCGICAAECPCVAIVMENPTGGPISERLTVDLPAPHADGFVPAIMALCCGRSASAAWELAVCAGYVLPEGLKVITVPCGGTVSTAHLLAAFTMGADGVMVLTCHSGNCHSEKGNDYAADRVKGLSERFPRLGFEPGRIAHGTLASNMGRGFAETVCRFEEEIRALGPTKLGKS